MPKLDTAPAGTVARPPTRPKPAAAPPRPRPIAVQSPPSPDAVPEAFQQALKAESVIADWSKERIILTSTSLLLILHIKFPLPIPTIYHFATALTYFFLAPLVIITFLGEDLSKFGFTWPRWPYRPVPTAIALAAVTVLTVAAAFMPQYQAYYATRVPHDPVVLAVFVIFHLGLYFFAWEFFFRGYVLFGLRERFGAFAIVLQEVPFALMHMEKPPAEALTAGIAGLLFGTIAYRSGSFVPAFLIHWLMNVLLFGLIAMQT